MKRDDRGLSLVELIIAVSISAVIFAAATMFLSRAQRSYEVAEETIDMQVETQVLLEQLGSWVMESNRVKMEANLDAGGNVMILYNVPRNLDVADGGSMLGDRKTGRRIIWLDEKAMKLYMVEDPVAYPGDPDGPIDYAVYKEDGADNFKDVYCIGQYIKGFYASNTPEHPEKVQIKLSMKEGSEFYEIENIFTMRNEYIDIE